MKTISISALSCLCLCWLCLNIPVFGQSPDAATILKKVEETMQGTSSLQAEMKMTVVRPSWQREMKMKSWSKGDDYSLILMTAPARDKGVAYLKRQDEMWNWQPGIERMVKLPPSMLGQSWMGSDFTNDDLVRQSSIVDDYNSTVTGSETIEGRDCYTIELIAKEDAVTIWSKILMWVDKTDYLQLKTEFYDEDDYLINTMLGKNVKEMGGKIIATRLEIIAAEEEGNKTIMEYLSLTFDQPIKESFFSLQNVKRVR